MSILHWPLERTTFVVIDTETTGLDPGYDRIIEIAAVRVPRDDKEEPELLLDTLIDPEMPIKGTEIHGIRNDDVKGAPTFARVAAHFARSISDALIVAHNADFDVRFLAFELSRCGFKFRVPYICSMGLPRLMGVTTRQGLGKACACHDVPYVGGHCARDDAIATARLMTIYRRELLRLGVHDFRGLGARGSLRFMKSWVLEPWGDRVAAGMPKPKSFKARRASRSTKPTKNTTPQPSDYTFAAFEALSDYDISTHELDYLAQLQQEIGMTDEEVRASHATIFGWAITAVASDARVDRAEVMHLARVRECLVTLGWAPGDPI